MFRTETFAKLFFLVSCTGLLMYVMLAFYTFHTAYTAISQVKKFRDRIQNYPSTDISYSEDRFRNDLKYVLFWLVPNQTVVSEDGQGIFINSNCSYINCYVTYNKYLLNEDYRNFEAIVFNASVFRAWEERNLPQRRTLRQKYIFYSVESSNASPVCNLCAENYFNWTWTYKLNSDISSPLIEVRDTNNIIVAPKEKVKWITNVTVLSGISKTYEVKNKNNVKDFKKALVCIFNKCETSNNRIDYATKLQMVLKQKLMIFDIYGCTFLKCPDGGCVKEIKNKYYFYLAYEENSAVDYVTSEVVNAYDIGAVPVVIGGADYHKFLPDGSYINARNISVTSLADMIEYIIDNPLIYNSYHKWRKHYIIRKSRPLSGICELCKNLNDEVKFKTKSALKNFRSWWYSGSIYEKCTLNPDPSVAPQGNLKESDIVFYYNNLYGNNKNY